METEKEEVLLDNGDGLLDAGNLTKCKDAVCFICINSAEGLKRATGFFASIRIKGTEHKVIITNNHVIDNIADAANAVARFQYEGHSDGADKEARLLPDLLFLTNNALDYTIVGCEHQIIMHKFGIEPVQFDYEENIHVGDDIFIFQHPKGEAKKMSYQRVTKIERPFLFYNADTDIGSSGSLVVRKFKSIALHSKGSDSLRYNKGILCSEILNYLNYGTSTEVMASSSTSARVSNTSHACASKEPLLLQKTTEIRSWIHPTTGNTWPPKLPTMQPGDEMLLELSQDIVGYWKHLGRKLRVPNNKIEKIYRDHFKYRNIAAKAYAMLVEWRTNSLQNTTQDLYNSLVSYGKIDTARRHVLFSG